MQRNIYLFKFYYFCWRFKPLAALMIIYFAQVMQSYTAAAAVFAVFNVSYAIAKIPSGLLSDKIGRKPALVMACVFLTAAFISLAFSGQFEIKRLLYVFAVLWGCGEALSAGTIEAMMYETSCSLGCSDRFYAIYSQSMLFEQSGCAFGALCAMLITYFMPLQCVVWFSVLPPCMQLSVALFFVEPNIKKQSVTMSLRDAVSAFRQFKSNKILAFYTLSDVYFNTLCDAIHRLEGVYFKIFASEWIISLTRMLKYCCGMAGFAFMARLRKFCRTKIYFGSIGCNMFVNGAALIFNNIRTPFIFAFTNFFYGTASTAKTDILQHEYMPEYRATAQSIIQFAKGIFMAVIIVLCGIFADVYGIYATMVLLVILQFIGLFSAYIARRHFKIVETAHK